jgi:hypothetical protein
MISKRSVRCVRKHTVKIVFVGIYLVALIDSIPISLKRFIILTLEFAIGFGILIVGEGFIRRREDRLR